MIAIWDPHLRDYRPIVDVIPDLAAWPATLPVGSERGLPDSEQGAA